MEPHTSEKRVASVLEQEETPGERSLILQVEEVVVAKERCATVGKNGNNRAETRTG